MIYIGSAAVETERGPAAMESLRETRARAPCARGRRRGSGGGTMVFSGFLH